MSGTLRFYVDGILAYERLGVDLKMASLPLQCAGRVSASFTGGSAKTFTEKGVFNGFQGIQKAT